MFIPRSERNIDIVVYGATGYTGKLVCQHLKKHADGAVIAIGGRSKEKLEQTNKELGADFKIIVAHAFDKDALLALTNQTKAVITTAGPYATYGDALIEACVETGTHYFDLTAESTWVARKIAELEEKAKENNTIVITSAGYDSVPSDLGTLLAIQEFKKIGGSQAQVGHVTTGIYNKASISGGTFLTLLSGFDEKLSEAKKWMTDAYYLSPVKGTAHQRAGWIRNGPGLTGSLSPLELANVAVVYRSWGLLESNSTLIKPEERWGPNFSYCEFLAAPNKVKAFFGTLTLVLVAALFSLPPARWLALKFGPKSGAGPTQAEREDGWFKQLTTVQSVDDELQVRVILKGSQDPGYGWTSVCIAECALAVIKSYDSLPLLAKEGGFLTPATALGNVAADRLKKVGFLRVQTEVLKDSKKKNV